MIIYYLFVCESNIMSKKNKEDNIIQQYTTKNIDNDR